MSICESNNINKELIPYNKLPYLYSIYKKIRKDHLDYKIVRRALVLHCILPWDIAVKIINMADSYILYTRIEKINTQINQLCTVMYFPGGNISLLRYINVNIYLVLDVISRFLTLQENVTMFNSSLLDMFMPIVVLQLPLQLITIYTYECGALVDAADFVCHISRIGLWAIWTELLSFSIIRDP